MPRASRDRSRQQTSVSRMKVGFKYVVAGFSPRSTYTEMYILRPDRTQAKARDYIRGCQC
jgi:hypothetical protein